MSMKPEATFDFMAPCLATMVVSPPKLPVDA
jgi:hypothetical protein